MRFLVLGVSLVLMSACGPKLKPDPVMNAEQRLAEEERLAEEQEQKAATQGPSDTGDTELDSDKKSEFDEHQAKLELARAARSVSECPASMSPDDGPQPKGEPEISLVFEPSGRVKSASIPEPFADKPVGKCALRAMKAVILPSFAGADHPMTWKVDLTGKKDEAEKPGAKKKK